MTLPEGRGRFSFLLAMVLLLSLFLSHAPAEIYEWKDKNGNVVFSDTPPLGVEAKEKKVRIDRFERERPGKDAPKTETGNVQQYENTPSGNKRAYNEILVLMYMTDWCGYCRAARQHLNSLGVRLVEYNIERDTGKREEMKKKSGGSTGVPLIDVEGIIISGYDPDGIDRALEKKRGY